MALYKEIISDSGVPLSYHRVESVQIHTNFMNLIVVKSYVNEDKRIEEKEYYASQNEENFIQQPLNVFTKVKVYQTDYNQTMTVESSYEYLKTLPEFNGAIDVFDESDTVGINE